MEIIRLDIDALTPDPNNAKEHPKWQVDQIVNSIERFGNLDPIGIWGDNNIIVEGHGRYEALKALGYTEAECIRLDWLTEEERKAYALAHNKLTMNSGFDIEALNLNLAEVGDIDMSLFGFDKFDDTDVLTVQEDEAPDTPPARCERGQVWQLGEHRMMCGSSTDADDVKKLMADERADISLTSPPYGVANSSKIRSHYVRGKKTPKSFYNEHEDKKDEWQDLIESAFANMADVSDAQFINIQMLADNKLSLIDFIASHAENMCDIIVWDKCKAAPQMQKNVLNNEFEFVFIFSNDNSSRSIPFGDFHGSQSNILKIKTGANEYADIHRAVFPVELPFELMKIANNAKSVFDCFGGTGTTLIAAEQLGRKCFTMELDPHYCDVIIQRWENFTGKKAVLLND